MTVNDGLYEGLYLTTPKSGSPIFSTCTMLPAYTRTITIQSL
jgi:hypothetical protein